MQIREGSKTSSLVWALIIVSFVGFLDSSYLLAEKLLGRTPTCFIGGGCEVVTTSSYSVIFGVPIALFGAFFYLVVLLSSLLYQDFKNFIFIKIIVSLSFLAFLVSLYFVYLQFFVLKALCPYCLLSAGSSTLLFVFSSSLGLRMKIRLLILKNED